MAQLPTPAVLRVAGYVVSGICGALLIRHHVVSHNWGHGPSMHPTFPDSDIVFITSHLHKYGRGLKVGDIIQADHPMFLHEFVGKRVIGMPGDYVIRDPALSPTSGGAPMPGVENRDEPREEPRMIQVPEGHVWVVGDNLAWSRDSRFYGPLPMALIRGKIILAAEGPFSWQYLGQNQLLEVGTDEEEAKRDAERITATAQKNQDARLKSSAEVWQKEAGKTDASGPSKNLGTTQDSWTKG